MPYKSKIKQRESYNKWRINNPEKYREEQRLIRAAKKAHPVKNPCERCGEINGSERHHPDKTKPKEIIWLCKIHHEEAHHGILKCKVDGCTGKHVAKGYCNRHWKYFKRKTNPEWAEHMYAVRRAWRKMRVEKGLPYK